MRKPFPIAEVRRSIERLMRENGDKAKPLAESLGIGETGIRDIFLPKTKSVGGPKLAAIARHYGVTVEDILAGVASTSEGRQHPDQAWQPREETIRSALEAGLLSLTEPRATVADLPILAHGVSAVLQFVSDDPAREDSPGFPETVVGIVHTAIRNYKPPPERAS